MAKKSITNQSIFGHYKSEENMVTAALLHILKLGGEELINFILDARTQTLPSSEIAVLSQDDGTFAVSASTSDDTQGNLWGAKISKRLI